MHRAVRRSSLARPLSTVVLAVTLLGGCQKHGPGQPGQPGGPDVPTDVATLGAFDPAAVQPGPPPVPGPNRPLDVVDYGPQGRTEGHAELHVRFNQGVVPLDLRGSDGLEKLFTIDPPLPGSAFWKTPDLLVFQPSEPPRDCHSYRVRFNGGVVGLDGQRFDRAIAWEFETPRPTVVGSLPESAPLPAPEAGEPDPELDDASEGQVQRRDSVVLVQFDRPVTLNAARAHIQATARPLGDRKAADKPVRVRVRLPTKKERESYYYYGGDGLGLFAVQAASLWPGGSEVTVSVTPGLRSEAGPLPLDTPWSMVFRTYSAQALVAMNCAPAEPCGLEPISLRLRNPVEERQLRKISISPRPRYLDIHSVDDWGEGGNEILIEGQFIPGTTYTVRVPAELRDIYGQSIAGGATRSAVVAPRATMALSSSDGILAPGKPRTVGLESRHVRAVRVRAGVFTDEELQSVSLSSVDATTPFPARVIERDLKLSPSGKADWSSLALDVADLAGGALRPVLLEVSATELSDRAAEFGLPERVRGLFRLTDLGPLATVSLPASSVQVLRLSTGAPVPGARVFRSDAKQAGKLALLGVTDVAGMLALPAELVRLPVAVKPGEPARDNRPLRLTVVEAATDDHAHLDLTPPYMRTQSPKPDEESNPLRPGERLISRVVSERGVYRPGELVRVVGWTAVDTPFSRSNLGRLKPGTAVAFGLIDNFGKVVATHEARTTGEGKYWAELQVPADAALGRYTVKATLAGRTFEVAVKVEDYRVPEYTVEASARRTDILAGEHTPIDVHASYYFGGPVQIHRVTRQTSCSMQRYRPPGLEDIFAVGEPLPIGPSWHGAGPRVVESPPATPTPGRRELRETSTLEDRRYPHRCTVSVEVQDASLQGIGAETGFAVHPAAFYLGVAAPRGYHHAGERVSVPLRAVSPLGERMAAAGAVLQVTRSWRERGYKAEGGKQVFTGWVERSEKVKTCTLDLPASGADPGCALPKLEEGTYELSATAEERGSGRIARTLTSFHVHRKHPHVDTSWRSAPVERLEILVNQSRVQPGDTLEVAVRAPWPGAHGNLVLARGGIREVVPVQLVDKEALFKFTVDDTWTPEVNLQATIVKPPEPSSTYGKPYVHRTAVTVTQGSDQRRLKVTVEAPGRAGPGEKIPLRVRVRDEQDRPTAARVALWAVDEAVLDLTQHEVPDLLPSFIPDRHTETNPRDDYAALLHPYIADPEDPWFATLTLGGRGTGSGSGFGAGRSSKSPSVRMGAAGTAPPARSRFETTPVFLADVAVGKDGEAGVQAQLPDNLTTFRITAVASARLADGSATGRFGKNDARTVVTAPLVLRGALPRQLRPGDTAEIAAIVQNNTGSAGRLQVTARVVDGTGPAGQVLKLRSAAGASAEVEDGGQARLVFAVEAVAPGRPQIELQASLSPTAGGKPIRDGLRLPIPVAPERTLTERVAAYGTVADDQAVAIPIKIPTDVLPGHGGVTIDTSSTLLGGLEDAVHALVEYPYGCIEQTSSRLLPLIALHQLDRTYPLGIPDPEEFMRAGVARMLAMQAPSGGFAYWPGANDVHVYASAYATWVLHLASKAGYLVPADSLKRALDHLEGRVANLELAKLPVDWGYYDGVRVAIALHVLADAGRDVGKQVAALYPLRQRLPLFARGFLLMAMHRGDPQAPEVRTLQLELLGALTELPATAHTAETGAYSLDEFFASDARSDAITLMALLRVQPDHPVVVKLARGLLERRIGGAWRNTQENAYALVALVEYAKVYEAELPAFTARAWVGGANVLDLKFHGRELTTKTSFTDMATVLGMSQEPGASASPLLPVVLQRQGQGRLYYRLGAEWAPAQTDLPARAQGFTVTRKLRTSTGAATDQVPAGEPVAMDVTIHSETRVRYVVLDVPLPAGLEGVSRTLGAGRRAATLGGSRGWWVSHEEQRPDRVVVFADDLQPGTHHHTIDLRSTSRGRFSFPPAVAEAMYMPEVYGRTVGATLEVR